MFVPVVILPRNDVFPSSMQLARATSVGSRVVTAIASRFGLGGALFLYVGQGHGCYLNTMFGRFSILRRSILAFTS